MEDEIQDVMEPVCEFKDAAEWKGSCDWSGEGAARLAVANSVAAATLVVSSFILLSQRSRV